MATPSKEEHEDHEGRADVLLHPVRLRLVRFLASSGPSTARQLLAGLPDVPQATLYRHLKKLVEAGWLAVAEERQVRGALEKTYALPARGAIVGAEELAGMTRDDHERHFMSFLAVLLGDFERYLGSGPVDFVADRAGYRLMPLHATDEELDAAFEAIRAALLPLTRAEPGPNRRTFDFSTVCIPAEPRSSQEKE